MVILWVFLAVSYVQSTVDDSHHLENSTEDKQLQQLRYLRNETATELTVIKSSHVEIVHEHDTYPECNLAQR